MMNWAIMMVNCEIKLDAITTWIEEIAQVLSAELEEISLKATAGESNKANSLRRESHLATPRCSPSYLDLVYWSWLLSRTLFAL